MKRSLGVFAILSQIEIARATGLNHVYLGFWLAGHSKMHYKSGYSGFELLQFSEWRAFDTRATGLGIHAQ